MEEVSSSFSRVVDELGFNNGIEDRRKRLVFHSLRHTAASWMVNRGVSLPVIASILGHKTTIMTSRYSHVDQSAQRKAMAALEPHQEKGKILDFPKQMAAGQ